MVLSELLRIALGESPCLPEDGRRECRTFAEKGFQIGAMLPPESLGIP
jgi:hypothetical protein